MAHSIFAPMPETVEAYKALAQRDLELIMAQKEELEQLRAANWKLTKGNAKLMASRDKYRSLHRKLINGEY